MVFDTADTFVDMLVVLDCRSRDPHPIYPAGLVGTARGKGSGACSIPPRKIPRFPFVPTPAKQARLQLVSALVFGSQALNNQSTSFP